MNRIEKKFNTLKRTQKKAFIVFITAGYPNLSITEKLILELDKIDVDILELGVPFSDPLADGPLIQEASQVSLEKNTHLIDILNLVKKIRKDTQMPLCLMTYYNPVFCFGEEEFVRKAVVSGVDGVIIPDLPPEEAGAFIRIANKYNLDVICFVSPTTSKARIKYIAKLSRGFIYYVSLTGVTGPRKTLPLDLIENLKEIKKATWKPVCVGFGVSAPSQVRQIYKFADGVIVGSAIIKEIKENIGKADLIKRVAKFIKTLMGV